MLADFFFYIDKIPGLIFDWPLVLSIVRCKGTPLIIPVKGSKLAFAAVKTSRKKFESLPMLQKL